MNTRLKTILYIAAIFLAGGATGGFVGACTAKRMMFQHPPRPQEVAQRLRWQLQSKLQLTPTQQKRIDPILRKTDADLKAIHQETMSRVARLIQDSNGKIAAELSPEQKLKLAAMEKERREFLRNRFQGESGRPPGPPLPPHEESLPPPPDQRK